MTPIPATIAKPLIAGLRNEIIVHDDLARRLFAEIQPLDYRAAVKIALDKLRADKVETSWSDALYPIHSMIFGGMIEKLARRSEEIAANAKT